MHVRACECGRGLDECMYVCAWGGADATLFVSIRLYSHCHIVSETLMTRTGLWGATTGNMIINYARRMTTFEEELG